MSLCRLCLKECKDQSISLFHNDEQQEGEGITRLLILLAELLNLKLTSADELSVMSCTTCRQHLYDFHKFTTYVKEQQTYWSLKSSILKSELLAVEIDENNHDIIEATNVAVKDNSDEINLDFEDVFLEAEVFATHIEEDVEITANCNSKNIKRKLAANKTNNSKITRNICRKVKDTAETIHKCEEYMSANMPMNCEMCEATFDTFLLLQLHYDEEHKCKGYITCCERKLKRRDHLIDHIKYHLNPRQYECELCKKCLKSWSNLRNHMLLVHPTNEQVRFKCDACGKGFAGKKYYQRHIAHHETARNFVCKICNNNFTNQRGLSEHIKVVHEKASFICNHCGKEYRDKTNFRNHVAEHEGKIETPVQCSECGDWLKNKKCFLKHMKTHNPIDIKCQFCDRICHTMSAYTAHKKYAHSNAPIFTCKFCNKQIKAKERIREHLMTHTGEKCHTCPHCTREFRRKSNMNLHIKKCHSNKWQPTKVQRIEKLQKLAKSVET